MPYIPKLIQSSKRQSQCVDERVHDRNRDAQLAYRIAITTLNDDRQFSASDTRQTHA